MTSRFLFDCLFRCLGCLSLTLWISSASASVESDFQAARDAYQKGQSARFLKLADRFPADHILTSYIDFWRLKLHSAGPAEQQAFIRRYADSPLSNRMRFDLARQYGREANWPEFLSIYAAIGKPDRELNCIELRARLASDQRDSQAEVAGVALWRSSRDLPSSCEPLFAQLADRGVLTLADRLARLRLALDDGNLRLARELNARLPAEVRMASDALARVERAPEKLIIDVAKQASDGRVSGGEHNQGQSEAALYALTQIAKKSPQAAADIWQRHDANFSVLERRYGWAQIAMHAARLHDERALTWFQRAGGVSTDLQAAWQTRAALRAGNWLEVYRSIDAMPEALQKEAVWRYWKARALKALNAVYPANVLFAKLSREIHYYGVLAEEELPTKLEARSADYKVTPDDLRMAEARIGLRRALLLRELGDAGNAFAEWEWALQGMDDRALLAAAELARRNNWYDRAIATAEKTKEVHGFDLRYIAPYRDLASNYAQENNLDEAWVYGLMRQESRFVDYARSVVGAQGLMQIMPATAKWISSQLGLGKNLHAAVSKPEINIQFGTYYLKHIYDSLGQSPVLATAGYNAGPGRARRWQANVPLEGAIYVENIPFSETREYVKKVLANAMFYRHLFGGDRQPLKERLGVIPAHPKAKALAKTDLFTPTDAFIPLSAE